MNLKVSGLVTIMFLTQNVFAQKFTIQKLPQVSIGYSQIHSSSRVRFNIFCPELKVGLGLQKEWIGLRVYSALLGGITFEGSYRKEYSPVFDPTVHAFNELLLKETYSRNIYFVEIPVVVEKNVYREKLYVGLGPMFRFNVAYDDVESTSTGSINPHRDPVYFSVGLCSLVRYGFSERVDVGIGYTYGLSKLYTSYHAFTSRVLFARQNALQISLFLKR